MSAVSEVDAALDDLVNQFADPLSFLRELVQNALDAGTPAVEVRFEFRPADGDPDRGVMVIHVDDFGAGMDREIIDNRLTRLFSSDKDGDLTKIGRFGIGFVSIFAIEPDAVCVDTARGGESWRVLFDRDRNFRRIARDLPVDGTKIQVLKSVTRADFDALRARGERVLRYWCKHADAEITFDDVPVNEPFDLGARCQVRHEEPGTTIVVGYPQAGEPAFWGFYNRGLTLHEATATEGADAYEGIRVSFKISSRYLEHTLTRDNVLHDEHFAKALGLVRGLVADALPAHLFALLEGAAAGAADPEDVALDDDARRLLETATRHPEAYVGLPRQVASRSVVPRAGGGLATLEEAARAKRGGRLFWTPTPGLLSARATDELRAVILRADAPDEALPALLARLPGPPARRLDQAYCTSEPARDAVEAARWAPLERALGALLSAWGARISGVRAAHLAKGGPLAGAVAITQATPGELTPVDEARAVGTGLLSRRRWVLMNADHPLVDDLLGLAAATPSLAAYLAAKLLFLGTRLDPEVDGALARLALAQR